MGPTREMRARAGFGPGDWVRGAVALSAHSMAVALNGRILRMSGRAPEVLVSLAPMKRAFTGITVHSVDPVRKLLAVSVFIGDGLTGWSTIRLLQCEAAFPRRQRSGFHATVVIDTD